MLNQKNLLQDPIVSKRTLSLKSKIMSLVMGIVFVQGVISYISMRDFSINQHKNEESTLINARDSFTRTFADLFFERYGDVQAFALNSAFRSSDVGAMTEALNSYVHLYQIYQGILFFNMEGKLIASNTKGPDGKPLNVQAVRTGNFANTPWFQAALKEAYTEDKTKGITGTYVGPVGIDSLTQALTGQPQYGLHFSTLVKDASGKNLGVITSRSDFAWVEDIAKFVADRLVSQGVKSSNIKMVDAHGTVFLDFAHENSIAAKRNLNTLGKPSTASEGSEDVTRAIRGEQGLLITMNAIKKVPIVSAFARLNDVKFPEILGWSVLAQAKEKEVFANANSIMTRFYLSFAAVFAATLVLGSLYTAAISRRFTKVSLKLKESAERTSSVAFELTAGANSSAASISEQAAAVQETVASMAEMASMIALTSQNVRESMTLTHMATEKTEEGNRIMQRLVGSMDSIQQANGQLQNIGKVIAEITNKTGVINDIVFKTQLLSFNASIEAARAGQHGRGFAVVAAEVGNLAQMSGNAAKEIQTLLDESRAQVQSILERTQERVTEGQSVSADALATFAEIAKTIEGISEQIRSINQATQEQDIGVKQTSTAMIQMDAYAQKNNIAAQQVSMLASETQQESERLFRIMQASRILVQGSAAFQNIEIPRDVVDSLIDNDIPTFKSGRVPKIAPEARNDSTHFQLTANRSKTAAPSTPSASPENSQIVDILAAKQKRKEADNLKSVPPQRDESADEISADDETFRAS
jgi:methyl-accepting chemotaxis protein